MFKVTKTFTFDSAHYLRDYDGLCRNLHGHTYKLEVCISGEWLDDGGMLVDFGVLKKIVRENIINVYDHKVLNDIHPFTSLNPTAENMSREFFLVLDKVTSSHTNKHWVESVTVWETPTSYATFMPTRNKE